MLFVHNVQVLPNINDYLFHNIGMENSKAWWRESVGYIIYPSSFKDSNGDGVGDINGIRGKLPYLAELGINLIWICPLFKSPMDDNGYDVSDYLSVNPEFGTHEDLVKMLQEAHNLGIRILLDFTDRKSVV